VFSQSERICFMNNHIRRNFNIDILLNQNLVSQKMLLHFKPEIEIITKLYDRFFSLDLFRSLTENELTDLKD